MEMFDIIFLSETWQSEASIHMLQHTGPYLHVFTEKTKTGKVAPEVES